jgi:peptide chain release factor 2
MAVDFAQELKDLRATMESVRQVTDLDSLRTKITELEEQFGAPDLWDDPEAARELASRLSRANSELERITGLGTRG